MNIKNDILIKNIAIKYNILNVEKINELIIMLEWFYKKLSKKIESPFYLTLLKEFKEYSRFELVQSKDFVDMFLNSNKKYINSNY